MKSKEKKIAEFNPNNPATDDANIFGLPFNEAESDLILIPVPWEVTVSYQTGTAKAPAAILNASKQVDLYEPIYPGGWKHGIFLMPGNKKFYKIAKQCRKIAALILNSMFGVEKIKQKDLSKLYSLVNQAGAELKSELKKQTLDLIQQGKKVALVGGDHSTPLGFIDALATHHKEIGVLQIDAHCDLRKAYEGFTYSHASIMYNVLQLKGITKLVQVGIRDFCNEEMEVIEKDNRVEVFFDADLKKSKFYGEAWHSVCKRIIDTLPEKVYISFDIDGLDPKLCPNTGTPVPGGLEFEEAVYLMDMIAESGKTIVGFDLNEVAPGKNEWDANVGARLLYKMCNIFLKSSAQKKSVVKTGIDNIQLDKENAD